MGRNASTTLPLRIVQDLFFNISIPYRNSEKTSFKTELRRIVSIWQTEHKENTDDAFVSNYRYTVMQNQCLLIKNYPPEGKTFFELPS
jgi:hypothetical protein